MNASEKANKANLVLTLLAILFAVVIYVPGFFGFDVPTTRPVNFSVWMLFLLSIAGLASTADGRTSIVLYLWGVLMWWGAIALCVAVATTYLLGGKLPYKEVWYASIYLGINGLILWKYMRSIDL